MQLLIIKVIMRSSDSFSKIWFWNTEQKTDFICPGLDFVSRTVTQDGQT